MIREPLRIDYLYLENFVCLEAGLKKRKVEIDLTKTKHQINVLIGKIGSGKTFILSHLQPFATLGTLDIRNQDDLVIKGEDGLKIIKYSTPSDFYEIRHEYIYVEKSNSHTTKSYICKNGEELNPTGNVTSFKYIINTEFGLEQSYLRLLRLGQNVTGLLELSATERKTYVASLLERADVILALNKRLREELRTSNAQISVLTNKLAQIGMSKEEEYKLELENLKDEMHRLDKDIKEKESIIAKHEAKISIVAPNGYDVLVKEIQSMVESYDMLRNDRDILHNALMSLSDNDTIPETAKKMGSISNEIENNTNHRLHLQEDYNKYSEALSKVENQISIINNDEHIKTLKATYERLKSDTERNWAKIANFKCSYNSSYLMNLIIELQGIDMLIADIVQYDNDMIIKAYHSDASILSWARDKGDMLTGKRINLQKAINNLSYSANYTPMGVMYTPPFCPTENCPFKKTHPYTLSKGKSTNDINSEVEQIKNEMAQIDKELYVYAEYPTLYTKLQSLKGKFKSIFPVLKSINCLKTENELHIITRMDKQVWYDYDKIIDTEELCLIKEAYYESLEDLREIEEELKGYTVNSLDELMLKQSEYQTKMSDIYNEMKESLTRYTELNDEYAKLTELYQTLLDKQVNEEKLTNMNKQLDMMSEELKKAAKNADDIAPYEMIISQYKGEINEHRIRWTEYNNRSNLLSAKLSDLEYTKQEMEASLIDQKYLSLMVNATSSKEGIPLELINDFVIGCKDIVNDLTFNIFEDDIQLEPFQIDDKEFYVPYSINGKVVQDVTKASQGQRSLFGIALAYAFLQELNIPYNIPLMDEVNGPLHKNEQSKFLSMTLHQMKATGCVQVFLITHTALEEMPVNFIATSDEEVNLQNGSTLIKLFE